MKILWGVLLVLALGGCGTTQMERQNEADQWFGRAKMVMLAANVGVGAYNVLCKDVLANSGACTKDISDKINFAMEQGGRIMLATERVFAAANSTPGERLDAAKAAVAFVSELSVLLSNYGVTGLATTPVVLQSV